MTEAVIRARRNLPWGSLGVAALSAMLLAWTHPRLANLSPPDSSDDRTALPSAPREVTQALALGFRNVLADYYWLSAIQYYGTPKNQKEHCSGLFPLVDRLTDLDPRFEYAYQFGGEAIPFHEPESKVWRNTRNSIRLLRKAIPDHPTRWEVPWLLGFNLYTFWGEYLEAGHAMLLAATLADTFQQRADAMFAPPTYLRSLADRLLAQGNDVETAIDTTRLALASAMDPDVNKELQDRLSALLLQKQLADLNDAAQRLRQEGQAFSTADELLRLSGARIPPLDPYGDAVLIGPDGRVHSKNESKL